MLRTARAFRNLSLRNLSPFLLASMTEGSNFDFLFKVRMLSAGKPGNGLVNRKLKPMTGRSYWRLWRREIVRTTARNW